MKILKDSFTNFDKQRILEANDINSGEVKDIDYKEKIYSVTNIEEKEVDRENKTIVYVVTTSSIDREMEIVDPNGADKVNYDKSKKTVFFNHIYNQITGRSLWEKQKGETWIALLKFAADVTDFAKDLWNLAEAGFIGATSLGFIPKALEISALEDIKDLKPANRSDYDPKTMIWIWRKWEWLEYSLVGLPANQDALETEKLLKSGFVRSEEVKNYLQQELLIRKVAKIEDESCKMFHKELSEIKTELQSLKDYKAELDSLTKTIKNKSREKVGIEVSDAKIKEAIETGRARAFRAVTGKKLNN